MGRQLKRGIFPFDPAASYNLDNFNCGRPELDAFLKQDLVRQHNNGVLRAKLLLSDDDVPEIMGYYTLSGGSFEKEGMSSSLRRKIPYQNAPCILLGRLAIDKRLQGKGLGAMLVAHAAKTVYEAAQSVGVFALFTEAKDARAGKFYADLGFTQVKTSDQRLVYFFPTNSLESLTQQFTF